MQQKKKVSELTAANKALTQKHLQLGVKYKMLTAKNDKLMEIVEKFKKRERGNQRKLKLYEQTTTSEESRIRAAAPTLISTPRPSGASIGSDRNSAARTASSPSTS